MHLCRVSKRHHQILPISRIFVAIIWRWATPISHRKKSIYDLAANITEFVACSMLKPWRKIATTGHALLGLPLHWLAKSRWLPAAKSGNMGGAKKMILAVGGPFGNFRDRFDMKVYLYPMFFFGKASICISKWWFQHADFPYVWAALGRWMANPRFVE